MTTGLSLLFAFPTGDDPANATLLAASVFDAEQCQTFFRDDVDPDMREGWDQNVAGKWKYANDKSPQNVGELIRYNMMLPTAYEELGSWDEAKSRADDLLSRDPAITAQQYGAENGQTQQTAGGTE